MVPHCASCCCEGVELVEGFTGLQESGLKIKQWCPMQRHMLATSCSSFLRLAPVPGTKGLKVSKGWSHFNNVLGRS